MGRTALQYYCGNCENILDERENEIQYSPIIEPCPHCGTLLSETLQKRSLNTSTKQKVIFQKASTIPKLSLDIAELDSVLKFFTLNHKVCISGIQTQKIIERLCIRAQLPHRYGGLDSNVLLIDGANSSDLYQCVDFAQQYGLDVRKALNRIIASRAFTVYQLANLITHELEDAIKLYNSKIIIISNLLHFFTNDPFADSAEMASILKQVVKSLSKIKNCLVIVSLGMPTQFDGMVKKLFSSVIQINPSYNTLSVRINTDNKQSIVFLKKEQIVTVSN